jgi:carboxyl-terminal processing protease
MLDNNVAYIRLFTFGDNTTQELEAALKASLAQKPVGLILDLRANGGGYLKTAIEVGSQFVSKGPILFERYGNGKEQQYSALPGGLATKIPMIVLVDEGTASASEIVAGAIQDTGRGKLVGVTTYGKGSVQDWAELKNSQGAVRITIAHWLTPNKRLIDKQGLTPDLEVKLTEEDIKNQNDRQLTEAAKLLAPAQ